MKFLKAFFFDEKCGVICVRRVFGTLAFIIYIVAILHPHMDAKQHEALLYVAAGLFGLTTIDKVVTK